MGNYEAPPSYETLTRHATRAGAVIGSNSWGDDTQGRYDVSAMEFDALVRDADALAGGDQPYILEFSAGNAGPGSQTIGSPAVAKNVIATGASESYREDLFIYTDGPEAMADFSSRGPCEDGRIKPDVVAPGTWIASLQSASATDENAWTPIDDFYFHMGGTSQAGPHVSGAAAVFVQYYRSLFTNATPSPALVKAALINSAVDMDNASGTASVPNMDEGWGRVDLTEMIGSTRRFQFVDQGQTLATGDVSERRVVVGGSDEPLKITLAYTDVPGFPGAIPALVNDLDLEVVGPDGAVYRGNQFADGESIPNAPNADRINNVEAVYLASPDPGEYIIRVRAYNVPQDARADTAAVDQDFALVTSGNLALPGVAVMALDRKAYRANDQIKIRVTDTDLAGNASTSVNVRSTTEAAGENVLLQAASSSGVFTGIIATATGPAAADGRLQIAHGDVIQASYFDASAGTNRVASAIADFVAPVLSSVNSTNSFGEIIVSWISDEPANSIVRFGTNPALASLTQAVTNSGFTTAHTVVLDGLAAGPTYYFYVVSADVAGNVSTNTNGGTLFSFVVPQAATALLVDEYVDPYFGPPPLSGYTDALNQIGVSYDVWDGTSGNEPPLASLKRYRAVIWRVPELTGAWSAAEQLAISNYLNSGGSLFVASMEIFSRLDEVGAAAYIRNVLHVQSYLTDENGSTLAPEIIGSPNEPITSGLDIAMDYSVYANLWSSDVTGLGPDISDTMTPDASASPILSNDSGDIVGLRWPGIGQQAPGRLVLFTFPLDAVPMNGGTNDRVQLLRNVLAFLAPGASGVGTVALSSSAYSLPSVVTVEVGDSDLAGQGTLSVTAATTSQAAGISITLHETGNPGVFNGTFELISATNSPTPGKLRAQNGDPLTVDYVDASAGKTVQATATIDTLPPSISNVAAEPDYEQAVISWDTSEPADALVQFGESPILNHTAYDPALATSHVLTLPALNPHRIYYYRVVSRDAAGNAVVDDNHGQLYTFTTLTPLSPPWSDNMNSGATNWTVFDADGNQTSWTLGVPTNSLATSAHSPPNAWGSNLSGQQVDFAETFLISPAILLTGGNAATLQFWHDYDFTESSDFDILEYGQLLLLTNNASTPVTLAQYSDVSGGWIEENVDLSAYIGQVVYLVWDYELFSFDTRERPGWLVDDVSVTVTNMLSGTIQVTNNIWQAPFILTGPIFRNGKGTSLIITNAPPGEYTVTFGDVPYYQTPAPATNNLASGGLALFRGNYTFADANSNGIADAWETNFFGVISTNRTRLTDSDGDGMSDYAEFIAGTDPTSAASKLQISSVTMLPGGYVKLSWQSAVGHAYRVLGSTNAVTWAPVSGWIQATTAGTTFTLPPSGPGAPYLFRIEVQP